MRTFKIILFIGLGVFILNLFLLFPQEIPSKIQAIETLLDNNFSFWKIRKGEVVGGQKITVDDSNWPSIRAGQPVTDKISWWRHQFKVPAVFAGIKTQGSDITLSCTFRGLGIVEGKFFCNGQLKESFQLEFGNQTNRIKKDFLLTSAAKPEGSLLLAFRFDNKGRQPLIERKSAEAGAYFTLEQAKFLIKKAQKAHQWLDCFLLDLKTGAKLLDFLPGEASPPKRPVSPYYKRLSSSSEFQSLRETFKKAVFGFDLDSLRQGDFSKVKASLLKFYKNIKHISRFAQNYSLYLVGNSHIDLAWLWRWRESVEVVKQTFTAVLDNMEQFPDMVYVQSQAQAYKWMEDYYPQVFNRIKKKVKEGHWEIVGGMWVEPDCNLIDGESFIRQILYGKRYFKEKFGVEVKIGWNPDSFGYNWNIPQFFKKSGLNSFISQKLSWNDTNVFPYYLFWWQGPDGSRLLTYFPPTGYTGQLDAQRMVDGLQKFLKNTGLNQVLILYGLGNHGGGPNREMLNRAKSYQQQNIFPKLKHSTVDNFLKKIKKKNLDSLPVWNDELYLEYHRGTYTTQAEIKKLNRSSEVLLANTEKAASIAYMLGKEYPALDIKKAWEKVLMNQFHDILPGSGITPVYRDAKEFYGKAQAWLKKDFKEALSFLTQAINTESGPQGRPLFIFNSLSWQRDGLVKIKLPANLEKEKIVVLDERGKEVPSQLVSTDFGKNLCFIAHQVPALGYKIYKLQKGEAPGYGSSLEAKNTSLENRYFKVSFHPQTGNIISIFDKINKKEVLSTEACGNQLQLFEDIPDRWDAWNIGYTGRSWKLDKARHISISLKGPVMASIKVEKDFLGLSKARRAPTPDFPSSFFTQEIILYEDIPRIDINMKADWWEDHVLLKVAFPVNIYDSKATYEIPYAYIQRPTARHTDWEKARFEVPAIRWADLSEENYGVSLLNRCKYGYDIKDNVIRLTLLRSPRWPDPTADRGKHQFSYALYPHLGDWKRADTVQRGYEFNVPLMALLLDAHPGRLSPVYSFFKASPSNIILSSIKKAEDRKSLVLRLYEAEGEATTAIIELFQKPKALYELDLMENRLHSLSFKNKAFSLNFGKSEIKTIEVVY